MLRILLSSLQSTVQTQSVGTVIADAGCQLAEIAHTALSAPTQHGEHSSAYIPPCSLHPSSPQCSQFAIPCPQRPPNLLTPRPIPSRNLHPQVPPSPPPPPPPLFPRFRASKSGSRPIARASIISALPSAASGNKLRGAADSAAWPAGQCGVAGLSQRNPKLRSISRSSPRTAGAEGWVVRGI